MTVPAYYRSRSGRVFRVQRVREGAPTSADYRLRAFPVTLAPVPAPAPAPAPAPDVAMPSPQPTAVAEVAEHIDQATLREQIRRHQEVRTPEQVFEDLWQSLRLQLDGLTREGGGAGEAAG